MTRRIPTASDFLYTVQGPRRKTSASRPIRLAVVDSDYEPFAPWPDAVPAARVTFDGETTISTKAYPVADGFIPWPGNRVWLIPVGNSYVIGGSIDGPSSHGFWQDTDTGDAGVELGGGSYYDTQEGLVLAHDASVSGTLTAGARDLPVAEIQKGRSTLTFPVAAAAQTLAVVFPVAWPVGTVPIVMLNIATTTGSLPRITARATNITPTGFSLNILKSDAAEANFTLSALPVDWVAFATP
jgi:hypothetical protein